ncbi:hypothetical protein DRO30_01340 [Candidatus Bathyarchaeota archaeon]|nr:MAG: hypothetical protein DRO30_01340 [Candidatus Bathyarchaeota archaeon]
MNFFKRLKLKLEIKLFLYLCHKYHLERYPIWIAYRLQEIYKRYGIEKSIEELLKIHFKF